jgi:hypothetical protein
MKMLPSDSPLFKGVDWSSCNADPRVELYDFQNMDKAAVLDKDPSVSLFTAEGLQPEEVVGFLAANNFRSFVQKRTNSFAQDVATSAALLMDPNLYFKEGGRRIAGQVHREMEFKFSSTSEKSDLKKQTSQFVSSAQNQNVLESCDAILEELYMNAMFDAPREAANKSQLNCSYEMGVYSTMRLFQSDHRMLITCEDPFGSLDLKKFVKRMDEVYKKGAGEAMNLREDGGAGLGCVIMFEHCEALFLGVMPGQKTLVSCIVPLGMSYRQRDQVKKSLHLISS